MFGLDDLFGAFWTLCAYGPVFTLAGLVLLFSIKVWPKVTVPTWVAGSLVVGGCAMFAVYFVILLWIIATVGA